MLYIEGMTEFKLPSLPSFELPTFELPRVELPTVELPGQEQVAAFLRDVAYAGTGLVVLTAERVAELQRQLVDTLKSAVEQGAQRVRTMV
jgi:hypothetical protein